MIKKDVRKTIVASFMFLFNSFERIKIKNTIFITEQMKAFSLGVICMTDEFSQLGSQKLLQGLVSHELKPTFLFLTNLNLMNYDHIIKSM